MFPSPRARQATHDLVGEGVFTVSQLAREARIVIEEHLGAVVVEGELSNFRRPSSGHWYFTLKDASAQIRCAMFAGRNKLVRLAAADGMQVRVTGKVSLYEPRGDFQLIVDRLEAAGEGALRAAFEALKDKLAAEGLFDEARKKPLPPHPRHLTVISSPSGAALRDVLHVIERRFPGLKVLLIPTAVQGEAAEAQLVRALERAADLATDVVLITRGGGSLEDLWAFNLESVARAVAACPHPVVSAVGHQTDFAITDFVADVRAPTPSAAAELITPTREDLDRALSVLLARLDRHLHQELRYLRQAVVGLDRRLLDPASQIAQRMVQTDELDGRLRRAFRAATVSRQVSLAAAGRSLSLLDPARLIRTHQKALDTTRAVLIQRTRRVITERRLALAGSARALTAVSPLATLDRGYAVLTRTGPAGTAARTLTSVRDANPGDRLRALLADGSLDLTVSGLETTPPLSAPDLEGGD
ncbi:MAG TPA: exodeoxyribonuclease VII large subunit [Pseudomonadales bacterium]